MIKINQDKLAEIKAEEIRAERDRRIAECDWAMMPDAPTDKEAWAAYRQALRDVPQQHTFPLDPVWPSAPTSAEK
ncbi:tail fiber assembly protein [Siccibacter colletis]|jgi:hypothetical protein|uniref:Phage tail assembly chaperone n=1 Tax=Siccibacter colletis TaxID=1505757 RepID=A0ABY6JHC2_9ENTR|nr:tail fiber assembly protein [Siccibacter colletis]UYU33238.1 phage tail assembly chaperone [Siccibacter colletis]